MMDFVATRALFELPDHIVYLDGNSLGPLPKAARRRMEREVEAHWGDMLIRAWNEAGWIDLPDVVGEKIARLIGAGTGTVVAGDSTSVNLHKALMGALSLAGDRRIVLSDSGNFPTDLYVAQMALRALGRGHELKTVEPDAVSGAIDKDVAVLMLTEVDYRTGRLHNMPALTRKARDAGVITIWDLAHSAGALPVNVTEGGADFAVGCGCKYLNGGPGAPAFIYVRPEIGDAIDPALAGWMGHEAPFLFDPDYRPGVGIQRMRVGTPPILSMAALDTALDVWEGADMQAVRDRSIALSERFIAEIERRCPDLTLASPRDPARRGSQVSFRFAEGYPVMQALIGNSVIGDFRAPDIIRFGFAPLYIGMGDVEKAVEILERVMCEALWQRPQYRRQAKVT